MSLSRTCYAFHRMLRFVPHQKTDGTIVTRHARARPFGSWQGNDSPGAAGVVGVVTDQDSHHVIIDRFVIMVCKNKLRNTAGYHGFPKGSRKWLMDCWESEWEGPQREFFEETTVPAELLNLRLDANSQPKTVKAQCRRGEVTFFIADINFDSLCQCVVMSKEEDGVFTWTNQGDKDVFKAKLVPIKRVEKYIGGFRSMWNIWQDAKLGL